MGTLPDACFSQPCSMCWAVHCNQSGVFSCSVFFSKALSYFFSLSYLPSTLPWYTSPPFSCCAGFLLALPRYCLNGFSKPLFPWGYLCSLCWHLFYTSSRLHCCCHCLSLRNNFTVRICFFFSPACLTVMHEETTVRSVGLLPLPTDTAITSGFVTAYRRSHQSWGFCLGDRCFFLMLWSKWNHWTLFSYGNIMPFFQFSGK